MTLNEAPAIGSPESRKQGNKLKASYAFFLALLGAYLNMAAFGFHYGIVNHSIQLPLVTWLKNPSLYPGDPITEYFERYPSFFWHVIAFGSNWLGVRELLFVTFVLTKILFFLALVRLVSIFVSNYMFIAIICVAAALSPVLNRGTPFGNSDILNAVHTHSSLALAILLWLAPLLIERRWLMAGVLLGLATHINALFVIYALFAVLVFAWLDWRSHKTRILQAAAVFAALFLPWVFLSRGKLPLSYPPNFIETILMTYPRLVTLHFHAPRMLFFGASILLGAGLLIMVRRHLRIETNYRFELLAGASIIPVLIGVIGGELKSEHLMRLQFLRADSFLIPYCILYIQAAGALVLVHGHQSYPASAILIGVAAILFPLSEGFSLFLLLVLGFVLLIDPRKTFERINRKAAQTGPALQICLLGLLAGSTALIWLQTGWSLGKLVAFGSVVGGYLFYLSKFKGIPISASHVAAAECCLVLAITALGTIPGLSRLWNPMIPPDSMTAAWFEIQKWARDNTSSDECFLVPPSPAGFRAFSERPIWTDYRDGDIVFTYPEYTETWLSRMATLGVGLTDGDTYSRNVRNQYRTKSWNDLLAVARKNNLHYIVQFSNVNYDVVPLYRNDWFAAYRAGP